MQFDELRRRDFITLLGGAAVVWPGAARAQLAMPAIGFLDSRLPDAITDRLRGFREGLKDTGYVEGENVAIVYRLAGNQDDRLPELAADLVRRHVAVIAAEGTPSTFAPRPQPRRSRSFSSSGTIRCGSASSRASRDRAAT
jgi:putative tryptophan/tyrosine transport system substrate-binding protein